MKTGLAKGPPRVQRPPASATVEGLLEWAAAEIGRSCPETPLLDAQVILAALLGKDRFWLVLNRKHRLSHREAKAFEEAVERRCNHEPVAYITGRTEFYGRDFFCDRSALVPRPETELLVEAALEWADARQEDEPVRILDLGTGTGIIAISLLLEMEKAKAVATDKSVEALRLAARNAVFHEVDTRLGLLCADWFSAFSPKARFDLILSNPPYVARSETGLLDRTVLLHEPELALFDPTGQGPGALRHIFEMAARHLEPGGMVACETGFSQAAALAEEVRGLGLYRECGILKDLTGTERVVVART